MKIIIKIVFFLFLIFINWLAKAEDIDNVLDYKKVIKIWEQIKIDISNVIDQIKEEYETDIYTEWDVKWEKTKEWNIFESQFTTFWDKDINLRIYKIINWEKNIIINKEFKIFVYENSLLSFLDWSMDNDKINSFINLSKQNWLYVYSKIIDPKNIENENILNSIRSFNDNSDKKSYISIWGNKEFLFDVLSKINNDIQNSIYDENLDIVLISNFNIYVMQNYLNNFLVNKKWINDIIIFEDIYIWQITKNPNNISEIKEELKRNWYNFIDIDIEEKINHFLFISQFINNLSWKGLTTQWIYMLVIIPFLLVLVSVFKHLIWLSWLWIIIPVSYTILFFKFWILLAILFIILLLVINLILWRILNKYTLLYTPKVTLITTINIVFFILIINLLFNYWFVNTNINDIWFIILFLVIAERFITIIIGKEFREYKSNFLNTIIFWLLAYLFFDLNIVKVFLLAYPETIIILIPISFFIWRFTWLRVTEYFRFKEIINKVDE